MEDLWPLLLTVGTEPPRGQCAKVEAASSAQSTKCNAVCGKRWASAMPVNGTVPVLSPLPGPQHPTPVSGWDTFLILNQD